jgi:hypothetical protein
MGARHYNPQTGRFISPDPIGMPININLYDYAGGDPVNFIDPDGRYASYAYQLTRPVIISGWENFKTSFVEEVNRSLGINRAVKYFNRLSNFCYRHDLSHSKPYQVGSSELLNGAIGFINGICNTKEESMAKANKLSQYANGAKVYGVYNASNSIIGDPIDCGLGRLGCMTPPTQRLKDEWQSFFARSGPHAKFFQVCHSGGATHVKNALLTSPEEIRQRIIVLAIAPAEIISKMICYESYNYKSKNDFVTLLDIDGIINYRDELHVLEPHPNAGFFDHDFLSPTFAKTIEDHIKAFIEDYGGK